MPGKRSTFHSRDTKNNDKLAILAYMSSGGQRTFFLSSNLAMELTACKPSGEHQCYQLKKNKRLSLRAIFDFGLIFYPLYMNNI